jgi:hypothetical protein
MSQTVHIEIARKMSGYLIGVAAKIQNDSPSTLCMSDCRIAAWADSISTINP